MDRAGTGGAGATVAITDAYDAPQLESDTNTYSSLHGDAAFAPGQFSDHSVPEDATTGDDCGGNGWYGEQALDVEAVHGMAPAANVLYYGAASCNDDDLLVAARPGRDRQQGLDRHQLVGRADVRRGRRRRSTARSTRTS